MLDKLAAIEAKYEQLSAELATPAVQADNAKFVFSGSKSTSIDIPFKLENVPLP